MSFLNLNLNAGRPHSCLPSTLTLTSTFETNKASKDNLDDFISDVEYIKGLKGFLNED